MSAVDREQYPPFLEPWKQNAERVWVAKCNPTDTDHTGLIAARSGAPKAKLPLRTPLTIALLEEPSLKEEEQVDPLVKYYLQEGTSFRTHNLVPQNEIGRSAQLAYLAVPIPRIVGVQENFAGILEFVYDGEQPLQGVGVAVGNSWESPFSMRTSEDRYHSSTTLLQAAVLARHGITVDNAIRSNELFKGNQTGSLSESIYWAGLKLARRIQAEKVKLDDVNGTLYDVLSTYPYEIGPLAEKLGIDLEQYR